MNTIHKFWTFSRTSFVYMCTFLLLTSRYLGDAGMSLPSEHTMRKHQQSLLKDRISGSMIPLLFKSANAKGLDGMETRQVPCVTVVDLSRMITDYLDRHEMWVSFRHCSDLSIPAS